MKAPTIGVITRNWRMKLAALALAVLIWAVVSAEQVTTQWIPVRVDPAVRDPEFVLTGSAEPAEVRVQFVGPGRELWELALDRPQLVLPLREIGERRTFALDPQMVRIPQGLNVLARDVRPSVVTVGLERLASRNVPVHARMGRRLLERFVVDDLVVLPAEVRVTGPADRVGALEFLTTRTIEFLAEDSTFTRQVQLDTSALAGLSFSRARVSVSGRVDRRAVRALSPVTVYVPDGLVADPVQVQVRLQGAQRVLAPLSADRIRAVVVRDSLPAAIPPGGVDAPLLLEGVPESVTATPAPARVRVYDEDTRRAPPPVPDPASPDPGAGEDA